MNYKKKFIFRLHKLLTKNKNLKDMIHIFKMLYKAQN